MITLKKPKEPTPLDLEIRRLETDLSFAVSETERYDKISTQLVKLYKLRAETQPRMLVDANTWALIGANLAGILIVVGYEHGHVITTKAIGFIGKLR